MYRHVIEHPQWIPDTWQKRLDLRAGHDQGRIYRVFSVDRQPRPITRIDKLDTAGLVAALDSPSGWQRDVAQQLLVERQDRAAVPLLEKQAADCPRAEGRLHALATLAGFGAVRETILVKALADQHPGVRRHAVRLMAQLPALTAGSLAALLERTNDADAHVRLELAYTLGEIQGEPAGARAGAAIGQMFVADGNDRFLFAALMSSINKANVEHVLSQVVTDSRSAAPNQNLIGNLLDLAASFGNDQALARLVRYVTQDENGRFADWQFTAFARLLDSLARRNELLAKKVGQSKIPDADKILAAADRLLAAARKLAADPQAAVESRMATLRLLGRGRDRAETDIETLASFLAPQTSSELQQAAVQALGRLRSDRIPGLLLGPWRSYGPARRSQVLDLLAGRDEWAAELVAAVAAGNIAPTDFDAVRRQRLLEHRSLDVRQKAAKAFAVAANADRQKVVDQYQTALALAGDATRGAQLFAKACAQCHRLAGVGYEIGPDLASLTDKSAEALLVAVLDPNRAVESKFLSYVAETKAGMIYTGLLSSETGNSITLRGPEGKEQVVLRADLEELAGTSKSTMPEGIEKDLQPQELADVIAFVRANVPLPKRKEFAGNEPKPVAPAADGTLLLSAADCEIYGSTLIFEPQYKNLGYWSSLDDHTVWTVEVSRAGRYAVEFDWACDTSVAGNPWRLETGGGNLTGEVESTGNWETYRQKQIGEITVAPGHQRVVLRPARKPQGAMIDLRAIRLVPVR
jgi:putative heme-binding domain-containing protein